MDKCTTKAARQKRIAELLAWAKKIDQEADNIFIMGWADLSEQTRLKAKRLRARAAKLEKMGED